MRPELPRATPRPSRALAALRALALLCAAPSLTACSCSESDAPLNVLLVTLDTTRADFFSCYGSSESRTPSFDALAADGVRFANAVTTAGVTPVSHASILTGRFNHEHGLRVMSADGGYRLADDVPSLFPRLAEQGWATLAVHSAFPVSEHFGFERGFDEFQSVRGQMNTSGPRHQWNVASAQRRSDETTDLALELLRKQAGRPWALWIHYWDPHDSVLHPPGVAVPTFGPDATREELVAGTRAFYAREVGFVDEQFGRLVAALRERGEWERTLVIVVSDHGEGLGDHGWGFHRILYQEQIHTPFLLRAPGFDGGSAGAVLDPLVRTVDVAPTVLDYLGLAPLEGASGRSVRALVEGKADEPRVALADQINGYDSNAGELLLGERPQDAFLYCALDRRWKLVWRPSAPEQSELFDLVEDPRELANLWRRDHSEAQRLLRELARERPWVLQPFAEGSAGPDAAAQEALEDLGYAGNELVSEEWHWTSVGEPSWTSETFQKDPHGDPPILIAR